MHITALTTNTEIEQQIHRAQAEVAKAVTSGKYDSEQIAKEVNALAEVEGRVHVEYQLRNCLAARAAASQNFAIGLTDTEEVIGAEEITATLMRLVMTGADDGWSGRTNDVRRARFDGIRKAVQEYTASYALDRTIKASDEAVAANRRQAVQA